MHLTKSTTPISSSPQEDALAISITTAHPHLLTHAFPSCAGDSTPRPVTIAYFTGKATAASQILAYSQPTQERA